MMSDETHRTGRRPSDDEFPQSTPRSLAPIYYYRHLRRAHQYIQENLSERIMLSDVSAAVGVSPSRLSHLFKEKLGITFTQWLAEMRVERAKSLIIRDDITIVQLAHASGFSSYRSFHRSFTKLTGVSPSVYRAQLRSQIVTDIRKDPAD